MKVKWAGSGKDEEKFGKKMLGAKREEGKKNDEQFFPRFVHFPFPLYFEWFRLSLALFLILPFTHFKQFSSLNFPACENPFVFSPLSSNHNKWQNTFEPLQISLPRSLSPIPIHFALPLTLRWSKSYSFSLFDFFLSIPSFATDADGKMHREKNVI